jgi:hypothetical protein
LSRISIGTCSKCGKVNEINTKFELETLKPLGRPTRRDEDNIKKHLKVKTIMNIWVL